ncbi:MAG: protein kinase [Ignavibacteriales bacterium]|nr:protein kinase [Ignavibacteriales bacterium]
MINQRYVLKQELGRGRSRVFLCTDLEFSEKDIALKVLSKDADEGERRIFRNEFFTLKKLNHPGIIKAFEFSTILNCDPTDFDVETGSIFFTLEYFPGNTIGDIDFSDDPTLLKEIIKQICSTLFYLHLSNYIYFDLKTENILCRIEDRTAKIILIDMGFAAKQSEVNLQERRGSAEYIAPELLQNKPFDHRVDLYSLGMLFYKLVFKNFPFSKLSEIEIYKAHIEEDFTIGQTEIIPGLSKVISRLLEKDPDKRFENSLQILGKLNIQVDSLMAKDFQPASIFTGRSDIINIIRNFLSNSQISETYSLHGFDGAGKSSVVSELEYLFENAVVIRAGITKTGEEFLRFVFNRILYSPNVYSSIGDSLKSELAKFIGKENRKNTSELRTLLVSIAKSTQLMLVIDDYNQLDEFNLEFFQEVIPFLQVNGAKIILTDNSGIDSKVKKLYNITELDLSSFTSVQLHEFIDQSFFSLFPKTELEKIILRYADLLPGSLNNFISDSIFLGVLKFSAEGISIQADDEVDKILNGSQSEIFKLRIASLSEEEKNFAQILASFEINLDVQSMQALTGMSEKVVENILTELFYQNVIQNYQVINYIAFTTAGIKKFVYETIQDKKAFHKNIGNKIRERLSDFNKLETARHFELAGDTPAVFSLYKDEIENAESISAFSYQVKLLNKLSELHLTNEDQFYVFSLLAEKNYLLLNYSATLDSIEKLEKDISEKAKFSYLWLMKAKSLTETNKAQEGKDVLLSMLNIINEKQTRQIIHVELANAEYELNNFESSLEICQEIIQDPSTSNENKGKAHNLIALIHVNFKNNFQEAMNQFLSAAKYFNKSKIVSRLANTLNNIGNLHNLTGNTKEAELAWNEALNINSSIGSLVQEANQMLNYGVYYHDMFDHQNALEKFEGARKIFLSLGDNVGDAIAKLNLSELYIDLNEFNVIDRWLNEIIITFKEASMEEEVCEARFLDGYLNYILGDRNGLSRKILEYENFIKDKDFSNRSINHLKFLKALEGFSNEENNLIPAFSEVANWYFENGDKKNYLRAWNFSVENLIKCNQSESALSQQKDQKYIGIIANNIFFNAEKEYFLGRITKNLNAAKPALALNYFESALSLLNDEKILELTWKILIEIALCYKELGQISKAIHYSKYAYSTLKYLLENISNQRIRNFYYQKKSVSNAFEITKSILQNGG